MPPSPESPALWLRAKARELFWVDARSIALFRVCLGVMLILTYLNYLPHAGELLSDAGVFARQHALRDTDHFRISLYLANGTPVFAVLLLLLSIAAAACMIAGYRVRLSILASMALFQSLWFRNNEMAFGLHVAMMGLLGLTLFLPHEVSVRGKRDRLILSVAALALLIHAAAILYGAGIGKFREFQFWMGDANALTDLTLYYANNHLFTQALRHFPWLMRQLSRLTVLVELLAIPVLFMPVWTERIRTYAIPATLLFMLGVVLCIHVGIFPLLPALPALLLLPSSVWNRWEKSRMGRRLRADGIRLRIAARRRLTSVRVLLVRKHPVLRIASWVLLAVFAANTLQRSLGDPSPRFTAFANATGIGQTLDFLQLNETWDWIYKGHMDDKFLFSEHVTDGGSYFRNITETPYRAFFYNYRMNYTNAVMRNDWLVNRYIRYWCGNPPAGMPPGAVVKEVRLYVVAAESELQGKADAGDTYARQACPRPEGAEPRPEDIAALLDDPVPGNLLSFPILDSEQEYKEPAFGKTVEGNRISLGGAGYAAGIGTHANGRLTFYVEGAKRFTGIAGLDDEVNPENEPSVLLKVEGDGKVLWQSPLLTSSSTPQRIDLDITGIKRLTLVTDDAGLGKDGTLNYEDHASWGNPAVH